MRDQPNPIWNTPPRQVLLPNTEVHVWRVKLNQPAEIREGLAQYLSGDEMDRAARFHFEQDSYHFIVGRGVLRDLLGDYLHLSPANLVFAYGPNDKPKLAQGSADIDLRFNLSHSHGEALLAFSLGREIGVDIERVRPLKDAEAIASRYFSAQEIAAFLSLAPQQRDRGFFNCWTRKEAYIKALGAGLSHPLDAFDVTLKPGEPARLLDVRGDEAVALQQWSMIDLPPIPGYVAALITENPPWYLKGWDTGDVYQR